MSFSISKKQNLSDLLYYDIAEKRNGELQKALKEYRLLLSVLEFASYHLENGDLEKFDALVGENACQIRAIKIAVIASRNLIDFKKLNEQIANIQNKLEDLLSHKKIASLMQSNSSLKEVLEKEELNIELNFDEMFVCQSFLLSEAKEPQSTEKHMLSLTRKDKSAPKNLKRFGDVSSGFTEDVVRKARRSLAEASVHFVKELSWEIKEPSLIKMTSQDFIRKHNTWPCIPMFWTYKVLLRIAQKNLIPFVVHVKFLDKQDARYQVRDEEMLFFKPKTDQDCFSYIQTEPDETDLNSSACVVQGVACLETQHQHFCKTKWREVILKTSIIDIILAGAADHRQYPDSNIEIKTDDHEYENYKVIARQKGFSLDNPTTFFINHVYPTQVDKIMGLKRAASLLSVTA